MKSYHVVPMLALALLPALSHAQSVAITFDEGRVQEGDTLSNQYADLGVTFLPGSSVPGTGTTGSPLDPATDMTVTGTDVGGGTDPNAGLLVHSFSGWTNETSDAAMTLNFSNPISEITVQFNGVSDDLASGIFAVDTKGNLVSGIYDRTAGYSDVTLSGLRDIKQVVLTVGDFYDWIGINNIRFTQVPEPGSLALLFGMSLTSVGFLSRRRK